MRIIHAASEAVPFAKTGGLADVAAALPKALARDGHQVTLIVPYYPRHCRSGSDGIMRIEPTGLRFDIPIGPRTIEGELLHTRLPDAPVSVYLVSQPEYFDRDALYQIAGTNYPDNCERFIFFSRAVLETCRLVGLAPSIIHVHDWQTGLVPALLEIEERQRPGCERCASVITIHNMAYQGQFWHWDMPLTGLDWKYFNWQQMEFHGGLNLLKTGIVFADAITTVSPTYAREIQTPEFGCGLHGVLQSRLPDLTGILNGVDVGIWNPATDQHLACNYTRESVRAGKAACKSDLQQQFGLPVRGEVPLYGMISRMADQKGFDLVIGCAKAFLELDVQIVFLGTGEQQYETWLKRLEERYPQKVHTMIGFDESLAHRIEAAADIFVMPSRFEPCGLNQMYSLIYGTIPIVRSVGGLADSVVDASDENIADGTANGFRFDVYHPDALLEQLKRAASFYRDSQKWDRLIQNAMRKDWSWRQSACQYLEVYERALSKRNAVSTGR